MRVGLALGALGLAALCTFLAGPVKAAGLDLDAAYTWRGGIAGFGAYSGFEVSDDGSRFVAVADKGRFVTGRLLRRDGQLVGVEIDAEGPILDPLGNPVKRYDIDAEGAAFGVDGKLYVSFEANHRIWAYTNLGRQADALPLHKDFRSLQNNSGLEALFAGPEGGIYSIPERSGRLDRPYPVYRYANGTWSKAFTLNRQPPHLVTGADIGPDGRLYVLERHWNGLLGFSSRIRSFAFAPTGVSDERTLLDSPIGKHDNLEGIAAWRDPQGQIRLTVISDDNRSLLQRTEILEFIVAATPPLRPRPRP